MPTRPVLTVLGLLLVILLLSPFPVLAQPTQSQLSSTTPLSQIIPDLYLQHIVIIDETLLNFGATQAQVDKLVNNYGTALILSGAISGQLSTFPLGSSAGGFSWSYNPAIGTFTRASSSFGPMFAERALTVGKHKLNIGVNYERAAYTEFEGKSLQNGEIKFFTPFATSTFKTTIVGEDILTTTVTTDTMGFFVNYGVTDRLDVGVAVPIVRVSLDASDRLILLNSTTGAQVAASTFDDTISGHGTKTGLGDIVVRGKYNLVKQPGGGVAVGLDVRLPSGNEDELLGIPATQAKVYGIFSGTVGAVYPHVNLGYTYSRSRAKVSDPSTVFIDPPQEVNYVGGADVAIRPRLTVSGDLVGRMLRNTYRLTTTDVFGLGPNFSQFTFQTGQSYNLVLASGGARFNPVGNLLISANVLFPLNSAGLRDKFTPVIGVDWSF